MFWNASKELHDNAYPDLSWELNSEAEGPRLSFLRIKIFEAFTCLTGIPESSCWQYFLEFSKEEQLTFKLENV